MSGFTPGPWKAHPFSSIVGCPISAQPDPKKNTIIVAGTRSASTDFGDVDGFRAEVEANARLIAAAPEMYEALLAMIILAERGEKPIAVLAQAKEAIAKAEGRTP